MARAVLVTGFAGSGKSTVARELRRRGLDAYDIEGVEGMFRMVNKSTGEPVTGYDNTSVEDVLGHDWMCDVSELERLIEANADADSYCCGVSSNIDELLPLFDQVILLVASKPVLGRRLSARGPEEFGGDPDVQRLAMGWKDDFEDRLMKAGAVVVDADRPMDDVIMEILRLTSTALTTLRPKR